MDTINRRAALCGLVAGVAAVSSVSSISQAKERPQQGAGAAKAGEAHPHHKREKLSYKNEDFYTDGKFDEEKAKDAIVALCRYFRYPIFPGFREKLWVSDYGTGRYTELGLAAYGYCNNNKDKLGLTFMAQDLFLLPGQMLPEHWHLKGEGLAVKNEGWIIRCGESLIVGIGEPNLPECVKIPACHMNGTVETKHSVLAKAGQYVQLAAVESKHWQLAGPEGCIMTEVGNLHTDSAVRHNDKSINDHFLKG